MAGRTPRATAFRWVVFVVFLLAVGSLSFADRAPGVIKGGLQRMRDKAHDVERWVGIDWVDRSDVPLAWDTAGHVVLWALAGMLGYAALRRRSGIVMLALGLFALSAGVEVGQEYLSSSRTPQVSDLVANGVGVVVGIGMAAAIAAVAHHMGSRTPSLTR